MSEEMLTSAEKLERRQSYAPLIGRGERKMTEAEPTIRSKVIEETHVESSYEEGVRKVLTEVVQCVKDQVKASEPSDIKLGLLDICMDRSDFDIGVKSRGSLGCYLHDTSRREDTIGLRTAVHAEWESRRTKALLCLMSFFLKRNWRLRLERSIVSRSRRVMSPNPVRTMFFTIFRECASKEWIVVGQKRCQD